MANNVIKPWLEVYPSNQVLLRCQRSFSHFTILMKTHKRSFSHFTILMKKNKTNQPPQETNQNHQLLHFMSSDPPTASKGASRTDPHSSHRLRLLNPRSDGAAASVAQIAYQKRSMCSEKPRTLRHVSD